MAGTNLRDENSAGCTSETSQDRVRTISLKELGAKKAVAKWPRPVLVFGFRNVLDGDANALPEFVEHPTDGNFQFFSSIVLPIGDLSANVGHAVCANVAAGRRAHHLSLGRDLQLVNRDRTGGVSCAGRVLCLQIDCGRCLDV